MSLANEIEDIKTKIANDELDIEALRLQIQSFIERGLDVTDGWKRLAQLQHVQQSREEMLSLARVFQAMSRDPRKG
jgi:hypothetical protein